MTSKFQEIAAQKREAKAARAASKARSALSMRMGEQLRVGWESSWVSEQQRRGGYEKKLQSNEAWWPAALAVMREAEAQNALLVDILGRRLKLEVQVSDHLTDLALLSTPGLAADGSFGGSSARVPSNVASPIAIDERARIASLAAAASASSDLSPGRVLAVLGAEAATEALRRRRVALACTETLLQERLEPMAKDFATVVASTHSSGEGLLKSGRTVHSQVRQAFDRYDSVARALAKDFENPNEAHHAAAQLFASSRTEQMSVGENGTGGRSTSERPVDARRAANAAAAAESRRILEGLKASAGVTSSQSSAALGAPPFPLSPCSPSPEDEDAWLCELRWRTAVAWQGSLFRESTRRFRAKYEALHKAEHNRRVVWARTLEVWKESVVRSHGLAAFAAGSRHSAMQLLAPFSDSLARSVADAAGDPSLTHTELTEAIRRRVGVCLMDFAPDIAPPPALGGGAAAADATRTSENGNGISGGSDNDSARLPFEAVEAGSDEDDVDEGKGGRSGDEQGDFDTGDEGGAGGPDATAGCPASDDNGNEAASRDAGNEREGREGAAVGGGEEAASRREEEEEVVVEGVAGSKETKTNGQGPAQAAGRKRNGSSARGRPGIDMESLFPESPRNYSPLENNPMVIRCGLLEHRVYYGAGLITAWEPVLAVLTLQAHLLLLPVPKAALKAARRRADSMAAALHRKRLHERKQQQQQQQRAAASAQPEPAGDEAAEAPSRATAPSPAAPLLPLPPLPSPGPQAPPPHLVLAEVLARMDPTKPLQAQGTSKAAEAAAKARAEAAARSTTAALPSLPPPVALATPAVVCGNVASVEWAPKASACGCAFEVTELQHNSSPLGSGGFLGSLLPEGLVSAYESRVVGLKAGSQAKCFEWLTTLRTLSQDIQKAATSTSSQARGEGENAQQPHAGST